MEGEEILNLRDSYDSMTALPGEVFGCDDIQPRRIHLTDGENLSR